MASGRRPQWFKCNDKPPYTILIDKLTRINRSLKIDFLGEAQVSQFTAMLKAIYLIKRGLFSPKCLMIGGTPVMKCTFIPELSIR